MSIFDVMALVALLALAAAPIALFLLADGEEA